MWTCLSIPRLRCERCRHFLSFTGVTLSKILQLFCVLALGFLKSLLEGQNSFHHQFSSFVSVLDFGLWLQVSPLSVDGHDERKRRWSSRDQHPLLRREPDRGLLPTDQPADLGVPSIHQPRAALSRAGLRSVDANRLQSAQPWHLRGACPRPDAGSSEQPPPQGRDALPGECHPRRLQRPLSGRAGSGGHRR